jgi:hypothetical protein
MLTGVYETLRSAGRELVLELGERRSLQECLDEFSRGGRAASARRSSLDGETAGPAARPRRAPPSR